MVWMNIILAAWLLAMSIMDIKTCRIPVWLLSIGIGFVAVIATGSCLLGVCGYLEILCGLVPGGLLLLLAFMTKTVGYADGIILICVGAISGMENAWILLAFSLVIAAVWAGLMLTLGRVERKSVIPFVPFISVSWLLVQVI